MELDLTAFGDIVWIKFKLVVITSNMITYFDSDNKCLEYIVKYWGKTIVSM